jgi:SAM-dependent methyltransferase
MSPRKAESDALHYSYTHYADAGVAEGFDALRFGGPVGRYLLESQQAILAGALAPLGGRAIADVGTGTGRAAIGLAEAGARLVGFDASDEMLRVAASRAAAAGAAIRLGRADAHALPLGDQGVDAAVSLRVLMHAVDWRRCVGELCRVSRWRVVVDIPSARSLAALESAVRRLRQRLGRPVEAYRVIALGDLARTLAANGFDVVAAHRQFVLPIALHKAVGRIGFTRAVEGALAAVGLLRLLGSPITVVAERRTPAGARGGG